LVAAPFLFIAGFGYLASNARATTQLQLEVDETQRGRVMALWSVAFLGLRPFASLIDGLIAQAVGVRFAAIVLAMPALLAAVLIGRRIRAGVAGPPLADDRRDRDAQVAEPVRQGDVEPVWEVMRLCSDDDLVETAAVQAFLDRVHGIVADRDRSVDVDSGQERQRARKHLAGLRILNQQVEPSRPAGGAPADCVEDA